MNTSVIFGIGLLCYIVLMDAQNIAENPHEIASNSYPSVDVNTFLKNNPELIPSGKHNMTIKCECAVFDILSPTENTTAIYIHSPFDIECDCESTGKKNCNKVCAAFAEAATRNGPQLLCSTLGHYDNLMASVHSRTSGDKGWTFTGITAPDKICCHDYKVIPCKEKLENHVQNLL